MLKRFVALASAAAMLSACTAGPIANTLILDPSINSSVQALGNFTVTDLTNADAIAVKSGDTLAHQCFPVLIAFVQAQQAASNGAAGNTVSGAFSAFEAARTAAQGGATLISQSTLTGLESACGGLVQDVVNTPTKFMAALAGLGAAVPAK